MALVNLVNPVVRYIIAQFLYKKRYTEGGAPVRSRAEVRVMGKLSGVYCVLAILVIVQRNTQGI